MITTLVAWVAGIDGLNSFIGVLFGIGGTGAVATAVAAWRKYRSGQISDDESIIKRIYTQLDRQEKETEKAQGERDSERATRIASEERATRYKLQIIELGGKPYDEGPKQ